MIQDDKRVTAAESQQVRISVRVIPVSAGTEEKESPAEHLFVGTLLS